MFILEELSTELINKALDINVTSFDFDLGGEYDPVICIHYESTEEEGYLMLNLYEFAFKCKEWIRKTYHFELIPQITSFNSDLFVCTISAKGSQMLFAETGETELLSILGCANRIATKEWNK